VQHEDYVVVRETALFSGLTEPLIRQVLSQAIVRDYQRGETLFRQGEPADAFFVVISGWVKIYRLTRSGEEAIVGVFNRGQSFAEAAAFIQGRYPASGETVAESRLLRASTHKLVSCVQEYPEIGFAMLASTSRHLHSLVQQIEQLKARTSAQRVAEFLTTLCPVREGPCTVGLPYDKALIAGRLGMKPESLSRAFSRLRLFGLRIDHDTAAIADVAVLRRFVDEEQEELNRQHRA
jgi:CRP-like cAMP-binding protein